MKETIKGFSDYTGKKAKKRQKLKEFLIKQFELYGFEPAETPVIEEEKFVVGENQQDDAVSDTYKLKDKGNRNLALRYEFTFQLKRIARNKKLPYKRYQIGYVFRDEPVKSNRFRQFTQCDVDIIGSEIKDEAEILALTSRILDKLQINAEISINNRKLLNEILSELGIDKKQWNNIIREIDKLDKKPEREIRQALKKYDAGEFLDIIKDKENVKKYKAYDEIKLLQKFCKTYGVKTDFNPALSRGLSYYTGTIFEIKTKKMKETIIGGGSYLVNNITSTGISFGLERLSPLAKISINDKEVLIISIKQNEDSIKLAELLRDNNLKAEISYDNLSKALEYANSKDIPYAIFLGDKEVKKKKYKLRNMKTGEEVMLKEKKLIEKLL